ncbi:Transposase and inactivated derivatives, IS30 family [Carnobacterium iners]|uniref:Transposase and inactivated derivatives, IS30 family n=1 Tax=Carnobacterium iners TaxID=1073423 RepID=A0A1X7MRN6_9LACT|nr:IS30 family transposase [Carnobacterium iners]SEL36999.1 Transposase and inactivated derivatives, IS30 family [Carnobacterium iners]SMH27294.1 Transposase and inactivated derivatives, IS30 family [Carnobacterium iners]
MTQIKNNIDSQKGKHLSYAERCQIAVLKKEKYTNRQVANILNRAPQTINNEINRGSITQLKRQAQKEKTYNYYTLIYDADAGQTFYEEQRMNCGRRPKWADTDTFIDWADDKMLKEKWSPDVVIGFALKQELFDPSIIPCTSTLYQWIDRGVMRTKNMDLLEKLSRKTKEKAHGKLPNKRILGVSIEKRPEIIDSRETFGHWEIDTVVGSKTKCDAVLLTLAERQTRFEVIFKLNGKDAKSVDRAIQDLRNRSGEYFDRLFKTITSDNGSEFSGLHEALQDVIDVYFSHPYASWERGTSENQHKLIRRFIPKGSPISDVSEAQLIRIQQWMNDYPRRILDYQTPHDCLARAFKEECLAA